MGRCGRSGSLRMFRHSKGMELQVSFLVVMIISIVIFGFGMYIISQFFSATKEIQGGIDAQTQAEVERRLMDSGDKVSIPFNKKTASLGETATFGLGILNSAESVDRCTDPKGGTTACNRFKVAISFNKAVDSKDQKDFPAGTEAEQSYLNENWISSSLPVLELAPNQLKVVSLPVRVGQKMSSTLPTKRNAIYIFNVCVGDKNMDVSNCKTPDAAFIQKLHGQKVLKLYVQIS